MPGLMPALQARQPRSAQKEVRPEFALELPLGHLVHELAEFIIAELLADAAQAAADVASNCFPALAVKFALTAHPMLVRLTA